MKIILRSNITIAVLLAALLFWACQDDDSSSPKLKITDFSPSSGLPGESVTITGQKFSPNGPDNVVKFNGEAATVTQASETRLIVTIPPAATTGRITITVNGVTATSGVDFIILESTITGFTPTSGVHGASVVIFGTNFSTTPSENIVKFNGAVATVTQATSGQLSATVPADATTGKISVTVRGKTVTSQNDFTVQAPTIESMWPPIAAPGMAVKITGTNFSAIAENNIVKFNGTAAEVTAASNVELTAIVPVGATTGTVSVKVGPNTATSGTSFEVCNGSPELVISDIVIQNTSGATQYTVSFKITNVGSANADISKISMQNYAAIDEQGSSKVAASGFSFPNAPTALVPGQSYDVTNYVCGIVGGNTTSHPYLQINIADNPDGSVPECNTNNNTVIKAFNP